MRRPEVGAESPPGATREEIGDLVDRAGSRALLVRESLGEFTAIVLALRFKDDKITHEDAAVTSNTMRHDLTSIQELVQVPSRVTPMSTCWRSCRARHRDDVDEGVEPAVVIRVRRVQRQPLGGGCGGDHEVGGPAAG